MKKRSLYILLAVLTVFLVISFSAFEKTEIRNNEKRFSSLQTSDIDAIIEKRKEAEPWFSDIVFNGIPLIYDKDDRCFYYSLPENTDDAYDPLVSWESNDIDVAFSDQQLNDELIYNNGSITVLVYDNSRYSINELKCTTLPFININKFYDDVQFNYEDSVITFYDNTLNSIETYDGKVRIRGGSTAELPKPGLRIELNKILKGDNNQEEKYYSIFGLEEDNEFVLYTCNEEKDHIRNVFSTNLWYDTCADNNEFNYKLGMSYRVCEVFVNNKYWGLCALGNPISEKRHYVDLKKKSEKYPLENIYKVNFFGDRYLLDHEQYPKDYFFAIKTNEDIPEAWKPFDDFMKLLLNSDDVEKLYDSVDINNAVDIYLFYNFIQAWDNAWFEDNLKFRNTYLVSKVMDDGSIKMLYIPWDLDRTWGHCREDGLEYLMDYTSNYDMVVTPIENLLNMNDDNIKKLLYERYKELRSVAWSNENLLKMLDKYEKQVYGSGAFFRDCDRWPDNWHADNKDLGSFKEYVLNRAAYFDEYVDEKYADGIMLESE